MIKGAAVLSTAVDNAITTLVLAAGGDAAVVNDIIKIDTEQMKVTVVTDATHWTVVRAQNGTTAAAHVANSLIRIGVQTSPTTPLLLRVVTPAQDPAAQLVRFATSYGEPGAQNVRMG